MPDDDQQLLDRARAGQPEALEQLLERHQAQVYRFGMKMCRDPEDAKDVLQDTLLSVARNVRDFRAGSSLSTWLYTIARSFCVKKRRKSKFAPQGAVATLDAAAEHVPDPRATAARLAVRQQIAPLLGIPTELPAASGTCPDVLALFSAHLEGQVSAEVCAEMERHIEVCPRCKGTCDSLKRTLSLCHAAAPAAAVPAAVQASVKVALRNFLAGGS
jgi:RNA polymerase sigma-70 factor, ECF subfamily